MRIVELDGVVMVVTVHGDPDTDGNVMLEQHGCAWFATCTNDATVIIDHPIITAGVPTCERCAKIAAKGRQ